jgi:NAD(P)-dependent dehydrogenase (short-subunit alcohol dehydrogenase family)
MTAISAGAALVTGAGLRIGRAIALDLAAHGWVGAAHYHRSADAAARLADEIKTAGGRAVAIGADLGDAADVEALVPRAGAAIGPLTLLVNNASRFDNDSVDTATLQSWEAHLDVNLRAPFFLTQAFARQLPDGANGNVINLIDMRVWKPTPYFASYTVSKAGLWTLTQTMAMALAPRIRVNGIGPGPVLPSARQTPEQFARQWHSTPLGRGATPEEIAATVRFILAASAMTGQMIALDGGQHLPWQPRKDGPISTE